MQTHAGFRNLLLALLALFPATLPASECGWEWCACKGDLARRLLEDGLGARGGERRYAPDREVDVTHVKLDLTPDFANRSLDGTCTLTFAPIALPLRELRLDAIDLAIEAVESSHEIEAWNPDRDTLVITFREAIPPGEESRVSVTYSATPREGWYFRTAAMGYPEGDDHFFTQGEPERHQHWFPGFDYPNERFTSEVICRVPEGMTVLSNGRLAEESVADGKAVFHWKQEKEHVNYLISVVGGQFRKLEDRHGDLPLAFYTPPSHFEVAANSFRDTAKIIPFFEREIGLGYPWAKYFNVCVADFMAGGMENTSVTTLTTRTLFSDASENIRTSHRLDAHEVAHQWFGNLVTCRDWSHLWLNEGFATYYTHLYEEEKNGRDAMLYGLYQDAERVLGAKDTKPIVWRGYSDPMEQFDYRAYPKGGWVLHMLRSRLGPELYRECIRSYLEANRNRSVRTSDLAAALEEKTGRSWDRFFDQWVYHGGTPRVKATYAWDEGRSQAKVRLEQTQKTGSEVLLFDLEVPVRFLAKDGTRHDFTAPLKRQAEDFFFELPERPIAVRIDPDFTLLAAVEFRLPNPMLHAQLGLEDDMMGRLFAVKQLGGRKDRDSLDLLGKALFGDPFHGVRIEAARALAKTHTPEALERLLAMWDQEDARVRQEVVRAIGKFFDPEARDLLAERAVKEPNPDVAKEAVSALGVYPAGEVRDALLASLGRSSHENVLAMAAVAAMRAQADPLYLEPLRAHLEEHADSFAARDLGTALNALAALARDEEAVVRAPVREFVAGFATSPKDQLRPRAIEALGLLGDPGAVALLATFEGTGEPESAESKAARKAVEKINGEKKQADEVGALRREVLELQKQLRELKTKVDTIGKQEAAKESGDAAK